MKNSIISHSTTTLIFIASICTTSLFATKITMSGDLIIKKPLMRRASITGYLVKNRWRALLSHAPSGGQKTAKKTVSGTKKYTQSRPSRENIKITIEYLETPGIQVSLENLTIIEDPDLFDGPKKDSFSTQLAEKIKRLSTNPKQNIGTMTLQDDLGKFLTQLQTSRHNFMQGQSQVFLVNVSPATKNENDCAKFVELIMAYTPLEVTIFIKESALQPLIDIAPNFIESIVDFFTSPEE